MAIYGYARCSTNESRQDVSRQIRWLKEQGCSDETIYTEYESGAKANRAELTKLMTLLREGDALLVQDLTRLTRRVKQLCEIMELVQERKLKLIAGSFVIDCSAGESDPFTEGVLKIIGVVGEMQRNMLISNVRSGLDNARAKGKTLGRKKLTSEDIPSTFRRYAQKHFAGEINASKLARLTNVSRPIANRYVRLLRAETEE